MKLKDLTIKEQCKANIWLLQLDSDMTKILADQYNETGTIKDLMNFKDHLLKSNTDEMIQDFLRLEKIRAEQILNTIEKKH